MNNPHALLLILGGISIALLVGTSLTREALKKRLSDALLIAVTLFVATFLCIAVSTNKVMKPNLSAKADQAEMQVRIVSCFAWVEDTIAQNTAGGASPRPGGEQIKLPGTNTAKQRSDREKQRRDAFDKAEEALRTALKQEPTNRIFQAKLAVMLLVDDRKKNHFEIKELTEQLSNANGRNSSEDAAFATLGSTIKQIISDSSFGKKQLEDARTNMEETLPTGWYRNNALLVLYQSTNDESHLKGLKEEITNQYVAVFAKLAVLLVLMLAGGLIGVINIFVQLALVGRDKLSAPAGQNSEALKSALGAVPDAPPAAPSDAVGLELPWRTMYAVFVGWFACYVATSLVSHYIIGKSPSFTTQPLIVGAVTALTYLISNMPVPLLINYVAFKPRNWPFWSTLKLRIHTSTAGPFKLFAAGVLGWCTAIPLIAVSALAASKLMGSQGSDNPVIGQIVQAAGSPNIFATMLFYFTLGVMAPFFEEMLFRGFLYSSLKKKIGTPLAMIASAALFATMHFDRGGILMLFAIGFVLAYTFEKTRSLVPSMIAHGLWNSGTFTLALILFST